MLVIQKMLRYARGYVKVKVSGDSAERFLNLCSHHQILIWKLEPKKNTYELYMTLQGFRKLRPLARKTHTRITVVQRVGLPFFIARNRQRQAFFGGLLLCIGLLFFYSSFIWDIHFEGNETRTSETLLEFLDTKDVTPAMPKKAVDCFQIAKDIRAQYPDIVWVSASINGSRLKIRIKENEDTIPKEEQKSPLPEGEAFGETHPFDLIASEDGIITAMITRSGVPQVHVGDAVKKGDILVSGRIEVLNDAKEVVDYRYCRSDADIYADTVMHYQNSMPLTYLEKSYERSKLHKGWYVKFGKRMFSVGFTKAKKGENREKYTSEHQIKLGESFYLPVSYGEVYIKPYKTKEKKYTKKELQRHLTEEFDSFLEDLKEKGIQICENDVKIHLDETSAVAEGMLYLNKQITEPADTEILVIERTNEDESIGTDD